MYPAHQSNEPAGQPGYLPYFYQWGHFLRYAVPANLAPSRSYQAVASVYDFTPGSFPAQVPDRGRTVEEIIARGYFAVPNADPVTAIIMDKAHTTRLSLDDVIHQIRQRYAVYQRNIDELNQTVCEVHNSLFRQIAEHGTLVANQRQQYSAAKQVQKLYEQQRRERIDLWRDVSRLRSALPETAQGYLAAYRKAAVLKNEPGDGP